MAKIEKIAISGKARSGKSTLSSLLIKNFEVKENDVKVIAFADAIKQMISIMFPEASLECLYGKSELRQNIISPNYKDKNNNILTYRQALIDIGTLGRKYNNDLWVNKVKVELSKVEKNCKLLIVNDVRFINEFKYLKQEGFFTIRIKREESLKINDVSEQQQDEIGDEAFDFVLHNNSTMEDLDNSVNFLIFNRLLKT